MTAHTPEGSGAGMGNVTISIDRALIDELREIAKKNRRSLNQQAGLYIDQGIERERLAEIEDKSHARGVA